MALSTKDRLLGATSLAGAATWAFWYYKRQQRRLVSSFEGQSVLITGGSRGLGLEMARRWASEGARVAICARTEADLERARRQLSGLGADFLAVACDITQRDQAEELIESVAERFGRLDVLVNNAGIIQTGPVECMTLDDFQVAMDTHFWGPLYLMRAALRHLRAGGRGRIVNIASIGGEIGVPHLVPYSASKFALVGLSEAYGAELRPAGIQVTTVCPGLMRTGSARNALYKGRHRAEYAWFSIGDSLPGISISSHNAARRIVEACRLGQPYLRLTLPAKFAVPLRNVAPNVADFLVGLVARLLPSVAVADSSTYKGTQSFSPWSPSILTALNEAAAERNNELG